MNTSTRVVLVLAVVLLWHGAAVAKEPVMEGEVSYVTGGTGTDERKALDATSDRYNLKLEHARPSGEYVSDVHVRIANGQGKAVIDAVTDGPLLYAQLPAGTYTVTCTFDGKEQKRTVQVGAGPQQHIAMTWSGTDAADAPPSR